MKKSPRGNPVGGVGVKRRALPPTWSDGAGLSVTESLGVLVAFSAGLFSFLSPCVLPLFPSYLSFITGMSVEPDARAKPALEADHRPVGGLAARNAWFTPRGS